MTGRIHYTPEAQQQLNELDDWITRRHQLSSLSDSCRRSSTASTPSWCSRSPGRARDDVRPGMQTTTFRKRTLVAYEADESSGELVVNILGVFHGGQDWEAELGEGKDDPGPSR